MIHDFHDSLAKSHAQANASWWLAVYREAFPDLESYPCVRRDGWAQRAGIDRVLTLGSGKVLTVDEKVRYEDYPDILLEIWSDEKRRKRGWIQKELACDYIAYAFVPSETCYLLPFQSLRRAWRIHGDEWVASYRRIEAQNVGYMTVSVAVPIPILLDAIRDAMVIHWCKEAAE